uniref:Transcriptional regulator, HxlR family n=1 Tax=Sphingobacterium sp. (strain 21) TaxID=743722 RepID=F4C4S7_SPHS2
MYERKNLPTLGCGLDLVGEVLFGKWKMRLLWLINKGYLRPSQLQRQIPDASRRVLTIQLKELEQHEFVTRIVHPVVPPKVEYHLTEFGKTLVPIIDTFGQWGENHQEQLKSVITRNFNIN